MHKEERRYCNMKLLFVCQYYYPERIGLIDICEELVKRGNEVTVLTGLPNYPKGFIPNEYKFFRKRKETINGVNVIRSFEIGRRKGKIMLCINYVSFYLSSLLKVRHIDSDFDKVICYQHSPITMASAARWYAKKRKKEFILYCFDLWPESLKTYNIRESNFIFKIVKKISNRIYSSCDKIIVSSEPFIEYFTNFHKIDAKKITYLPQFSYDYGANLNIRKKDNIIHLLYAGNVGKVQNVECIISAINILKTEKKYVVDIVGYGSNFDKLNKMIKDYDLNDKILLHGEKNKEELQCFYDIADALLLTLTDNSFISKTLPLKLQSYMTTEKPILAAINGAAQDMIKEYKCGFCVNANDYIGYSKIIKDFLDGKIKVKYKKNKEFLLKNNVDKLQNIIIK